MLNQGSHVGKFNATFTSWIGDCEVYSSKNPANSLFSFKLEQGFENEVIHAGEMVT